VCIKTTDCLIGSQLSVVNKIAVTDIPVPNVILVIQFATASFLLGLAHMFGMIKLENINMRMCIGFLPFVACFFALLSSGMWVMKVAPLETFIAFKSTTPIVLSMLDYMFMGRTFPSLKSLCAMAGITGGAVWYVSGDVKSEKIAYLYCAVFVFMACIEGGVAKDTINRYQLVVENIFGEHFVDTGRYRFVSPYR
jgi:GDP-mannose transporter